jgi:hypothetical protein
MLDSISNKELTEWVCYFKVKAQKEKDAQPAGNNGGANKQQTF